MASSFWANEDAAFDTTIMMKNYDTSART